jgi:hypothetical protein
LGTFRRPLLVHLEPPLALDVAEISAAAVADAAPDKLVINILHCLIPRQMFKNFEQIQFREKDTRAFVTSPCRIFFFFKFFGLLHLNCVFQSFEK